MFFLWFLGGNSNEKMFVYAPVFLQDLPESFVLSFSRYKGCLF